MMEIIYYTTRRFILILLSLAIIGMIDSCNLNDEWDEYYNETPGRNGEKVLALLSQNENYSQFYNALIKYGFEDLLSKNQYFTLFAPVNSAFEGLPEISNDDWKKIIGFHISYSKIYSRDFKDIDILTTIGKYIKMRTGENDEIRIFESSVNMDHVDNYCQNGVIHEIDKLLLPKPNLYEYIMSLDPSYSILQDFLLSMDSRYIDYENSVRIGVDDNGNAIYDTVWVTDNYFLDNIAGLNDESKPFTGFLATDDDVIEALKSVSSYFGNIEDMDEKTYQQLLFIAFGGSFMNDAYSFNDLPDTIISVTGKTVETSGLSTSQVNVEVSNGLVNILDQLTIPKNFFLLPIVIECDRKENRRLSNTNYITEQLSDTRASNGSYFQYGAVFVGDYIEFTVDMVLKTTYWLVWTGPKQGPSTYQLSVKDEITGDFVNVGPPVDNWKKGAFKLVTSGTYVFDRFGTKTIRMTVVDDLPVLGSCAIFIDYIKLIPDEIYNK